MALGASPRYYDKNRRLAPFRSQKVTHNPGKRNVNEPTIVNDEHYQHAITSLEHTLDRLRGCTDEEREHLRRDLDQLQAMARKLTEGRVEIVVFGEISTGKSALINALVGEAVTQPNGAYSFTSLTLGDYYAAIVLPSGWELSPVDQGGDEAADSEFNPATATSALISPAIVETIESIDAGLRWVGGYGFENGFLGWTVSNGAWEVGQPTSGPGRAHEGTNCVATVLAGNYPGHVGSRLVSPEFELPSASGDERVQLRFIGKGQINHFAELRFRLLQLPYRAFFL